MKVGNKLRISLFVFSLNDYFRFARGECECEVTEMKYFLVQEFSNCGLWHNVTENCDPTFAFAPGPKKAIISELEMNGEKPRAW